MKVKQWRHKSELHSFVNDVSSFSGESYNSFQMLEEYVSGFGGLYTM